MTSHRYAILTGQGRSGTNWLLDVLDASPRTFCRNEPNALAGSPFARLPPLWHMDAGHRELDEHWDDIARWTCSHMGERDHPIDIPKEYVHRWAQACRLTAMVAKDRRRAVVAKVVPRLRAAEWEMPSWIGHQDRLLDAYGVIKINRVCLVASWLFEHRPAVPVINIVRHPGGRHASYKKRFLAGRPSQEVLADSRANLRLIAAGSECWAELFGDIDAMGHTELQTWFWRYVTESMADAGEGHRQYHSVVYEDMTRDPMPHAKAVYGACGLEWTPEVEARIEAGRGESVWGQLAGSPQEVANAWRTKLDKDEIASIERILAGSSVAHWWS